MANPFGFRILWGEYISVAPSARPHFCFKNGFPKLAERGRFELPRTLAGPNAFREHPFQPLTHLSAAILSLFAPARLQADPQVRTDCRHPEGEDAVERVADRVGLFVHGNENLDAEDDRAHRHQKPLPRNWIINPAEGFKPMLFYHAKTLPQVDCRDQ